jgi:two-component system OmpR family response regulator
MGHILVVEDEPHIRFILRKMLEAEGHVVTETEDGLEGLNLINTHFTPFSLIILDVRLPKMDGFEFLYRLRRQERSHVPVLVLTAHRNLCAKAAEYGADRCMEKPFNRKQLVALVNSLNENQANKIVSFTWQPFSLQNPNLL